MLTMAENVIVAGANNHPPMLDKTQYSSWASRMLLYIKGKEHGKLLYDSVINGPFKYGTVTVPETQTTPATVRERTYDELTDAEKIHEACDIKATNIDRVKLLIEGSEISYQERESKLYDEFDTFTSVPGETIHAYYLRFAQLINDMHSILAKDLYITNFDHLYGYLRQHEDHANEATIQDGRVTVQMVQGRQTQGFTSSGARSNAIGVNRNAGNTIAGQAKVIRCYKCQEEGHMARQCTKL
ncbi:reverse transcriptase domain-containing protein [Tanacetum coccineum]|uniref:Reverse transcriptase domain-containing protein n=1 Tax=Tanacetum coccineum TaxID=301880 RepID=A0ABQ5ISA1_9ASTR